ncbi:MAG TPA: hypothetical protein PLN18_01910 [Candidatus Colwellbacteria bacterium]|nr:hypothetical protein [Candidatus Colwellbacteria bacterium]HQA96100.1 hypothetical protein [Candidatus Colwellbacteria bacterium]
MKCFCGRHFHKWGKRSGGSAVYGLGFIGALVYYMGHAASFQTVILGILKAFVWPAFFVYKAIEIWQI